MPVYTYKCKCGESSDKIHKVTEAPEVLCLKCQGIMSRFATGGSGSFIRGTTVGKYYKEDRLRRKKNAQLDVKQFERYGGQNKLVPNINGEEIESWKDAEKMVKGKGVRDTKKFEKYVREEESSRNADKVNEVRLKKLKEKARNVI